MKTLITSYHSPDLDGIACMYWYHELLAKQWKNNVEFWYIGTMFSEAEFALKECNIDTINNVESNFNNYDNYILVDTGILSSLKEFWKSIKPNQIVEIIDHHPFERQSKLKKTKIQNDKIGAAATIVVERFIKAKIDISKKSWKLLYLAIASNTLNLNAGTTTQRDIDAFSYLEDKFNLNKQTIHDMFEYKSKFDDLKTHFLIDTKFIGWKINYTQIEMIWINKLLNEKYNEIIAFMDKIKEDDNNDIWLISLIDIRENKNIFICRNTNIKQKIEQKLWIKFENDIAHKKWFILRKELSPMILNN